MTGCATAYWLKKLQRDGAKSCVVLDARGVAGGATGRNGGHLWANPESEFEREVTKDVLKFIEEEGVECDLTNGGAASLVRVAPPSGVKYNDRADTDPEVESGDEWGDGPTWDAATCAANLRTEAFAGARVFPEAAQFYPAAVTAAMLRASGAAYCAPARVLSIGEAAAGGKRVVTTDVGEIEAGVVVVATNAWAPELLPELAGQVSACRNQVIMTAPTAGAWEGVAALGVDGGARELYAIRRADGRICLGGARAIEPDAAVGNADDGSLSPEVGAYLRRYLAECFPKMHDGWRGWRRGEDRGGVDRRAGLHARRPAAVRPRARRRLRRRRLLRPRDAALLRRRQGDRADDRRPRRRGARVRAR